MTEMEQLRKKEERNPKFEHHKTFDGRKKEKTTDETTISDVVPTCFDEKNEERLDIRLRLRIINRCEFNHPFDIDENIKIRKIQKFN